MSHNRYPGFFRSCLMILTRGREHFPLNRLLRQAHEPSEEYPSSDDEDAERLNTNFGIKLNQFETYERTKRERSRSFRTIRRSGDEQTTDVYWRAGRREERAMSNLRKLNRCRQRVRAPLRVTGQSRREGWLRKAIEEKVIAAYRGRICRHKWQGAKEKNRRSQRKTTNWKPWSLRDYASGAKQQRRITRNSGEPDVRVFRSQRRIWKKMASAVRRI